MVDGFCISNISGRKPGLVGDISHLPRERTKFEYSPKIKTFLVQFCTIIAWRDESSRLIRNRGLLMIFVGNYEK